MYKFIAFIFSILLIGQISYAQNVQQNPVNLSVYSQEVEGFKSGMTDYQLTLQRGETGNCGKILASIIDMAEKEFNLTKKRHAWFQNFSCQAIDTEKMAYHLKGRVTKQEELLVGMQKISNKDVLDNASLNIASDYIQYFFESMKENLEESETIANSCGL